MNNLRPCQNCPLNCAYHGDDMCVSNLVQLVGERSPITYGLRVGLNHFYGGDALPPCVRGPLGNTYWSVDANPGSAEDHFPQPGLHTAFESPEV